MPTNPQVEFLGVGDATDFMLGQTSAIYRGGCSLLIDCGPQLPALVAQTAHAEELDGVYLTHTHADHCFGLPSLLLWMRQSGRKRPFTLLSEANSLAAIARLVEFGYPGAFGPGKCFALDLQPLSPALEYSLRSTRLRIAPTDHGVANFALRIEDQSTACAFSGDGRPNESTRHLFADLDLLTHECAFLARVSRSHTNADDIQQLVQVVAPRRIAVVHCSGSERPEIEARLWTELGNQVVFPRPGTRIQISRASHA